MMSTLAPRPRPLRIHGTIARDLGIRIVSGAVAPGDLLDGEVAASGSLNVSRTAYREALRMLAAKGLVESRPKTGTRVSPRDQWQLLDPDVLSWVFDTEPDPLLIGSLFELRKIVEPAAAQLAALRRDAAQLATMRQALAEMGNHTLATDIGREADQRFHAAMLDAANNPFLVTLTSGVGAAVAWTTIYKQRNSPLTRDPLPDHIRVFEAVEAGDGAAAHAAMTELVDMAFQDTRVTLPA